MERILRRTSLVIAALAALWITLLCATTAKAQNKPSAECIDQVYKGLKKPVVLIGVTGPNRTFRLIDDGDKGKNLCGSGKCTHVFVAADKALLPSAKIDGVSPTNGAVNSGPCKATPAQTATYVDVPAPTGACEQAIAKDCKIQKADAVLFVADGGAYARILRSGACNGACKKAYAMTNKDVGVPGHHGTFAAEVCGGKALFSADAANATDFDECGGATVAPRALQSVGDRQQAILDQYRGTKTGGANKAGFALPAALLPGVLNGGVEATSTASKAAGEVLQILGQIVVDRATDAAYLRARAEIERLLACDPLKKAPNLLLIGDKVKFPRTCKVVQSLRLQDLAVSRSVVVQALLQDVLQIVVANVHLPDNQKKAVEAMTLVLADILPELTTAAANGDTAAATALVWQLVQEGLQNAGSAIKDCKDDACRTVAIAAVAVIQCRLEAMNPDLKLTDRATALVACSVADHVEALAVSSTGEPISKNAQVVAMAKIIAVEWMGAQTATTSTGAPDYRARARFAVNAAFDTGCLWLEPNELKDARCPAQAPGELPKKDEAVKMAGAVASLSRLLIIAAIDGDTNTVITGLNHGVDIVVVQVGGAMNLSDDDKRALHKALRLLGGLLQYSETFLPTDAKADVATLHERRTKILESLSRDLTDRTGREDDAILSLGGSLRATLGARIDPAGKQDALFYGPVSLPLGVGFQSAGHFHLEIGIFDLGQYVSYQKGASGLTVREPKPADVLAPSLTLGYYWNKSFPFFIGVTGGYTPQFEFSKTSTTNAGSINLGFTTGIYVPLFDIN